MSHFSAEQQAVIDRGNRLMAAAGFPLSQILNDLYDLIEAGTIGITADAGDVDSLALGGGAFTRDKSTAPGTTLLFAWKASRFNNGKALVVVSAGSLTLSASTTNYIELDRTGAVTSNTTGFHAGQYALWTVATGSASYTDLNVVSKKAPIVLIGANGVDGSMLSTPGQTKEVAAQLGTVAATTTFYVISPDVAAVLVKAAFADSTAFATSDTDYWTFGILNLGPAGTGTTPMLDTGAGNTTKTTGGSALSVGLKRNLTLHTTPANLVTAAGDVLAVTLTKTGTPANLTLSTLRLDFTFQG
jgi:hypothetical protein